MAASKALVETISWVGRITQAEKDDILKNSDNDVLVQAVLDHDSTEHSDEWPESPESDSEGHWSHAVFYYGIDMSIERRPKSLEQALKWRDISTKANIIRRICDIYSGLDTTTLANVFLVTTCFALGRPLMPQHAVIRFLRNWANVNFEIPLPFPENSRSGLFANLSGRPPRNSVLSDTISTDKPFPTSSLKGVTEGIPVSAYDDFELLQASVSQTESRSDITAMRDDPSPAIPHSYTSSKFSPVSSKGIGGGQFFQSFPPPLLGPVLERIVENYVRGAYEQEHLMDTYMLIMSHPSVPQVRHAGRQLFDRISQIQTPYISPSLIVDDLLNSLEVDKNLHLPFTFQTMQELLRPPNSEVSGTTSTKTMRIVVDLIHSNVLNGYLPPEEALGFFKQRASVAETPDIAVLEGLAETFHVPTSCYDLQHSDPSVGSGSLNFEEDGFKTPVQQPQKQERPLRGDTIFPGLPLSDSEAGSLSPEDGVTEDFWGLLMPSKKARELTEKFNLVRMRDQIRSQTPHRQARRKGKIMARRRILRSSNNSFNNTGSSGDSLFALPDEDRNSFLKRNPPMKRLRPRKREREGTPVPGFQTNPPTAPVNVEPNVEPQPYSSDPIFPVDNLTAEPSAADLPPSAESSQTKESPVSLEANPSTEWTPMEIDTDKTGDITQEAQKGQTDEEKENLARLCPGEESTSLYPPPLSTHMQYNNAALRPTPANANFSSYFQSPQASSGANSSLNKIFDSYRDDVENKPEMIGIEGAMKYLGDIGVQLDEVACFAIAELLQSPSMGEFTRPGFLAGWKSANCETLQLQASYANTLRKRVVNEPDYFRRVYRYTFPICRLAGQKILPLEIACEQWRLFFTPSNGGITWNSPSTPWLDWWIEYLNEVFKRPINKDLWEQTEVLVRKTKEDENFGWWNAEGAWPGAIDDFVGWVKDKRGDSNSTAEAMEVE